MNKEQQLKALAETISKAQKQMEEINNEKIDLSEFVGRYETSLVIKWEKNLISYSNWDIGYAKIYTNFTTPDYTHTTVEELEKGDVFICEDKVEDMELESFNIYVHEWAAQFLNDSFSGDMIDWHRYYTDTKVIKFLRT